MTEKLKGKYQVTSLLHGELINVIGGGMFRITGETLGIEIQVCKAKDGDGDCIKLWVNGGSDNVHLVYPLADLRSFKAGSIRGCDFKIHGLLDGSIDTYTRMFPTASQAKVVLQFMPVKGDK
jgi:hypothetical protein